MAASEQNTTHQHYYYKRLYELCFMFYFMYYCWHLEWSSLHHAGSRERINFVVVVVVIIVIVVVVVPCDFGLIFIMLWFIKRYINGKFSWWLYLAKQGFAATYVPQHHFRAKLPSFPCEIGLDSLLNLVWFPFQTGLNSMKIFVCVAYKNSCSCLNGLVPVVFIYISSWSPL